MKILSASLDGLLVIEPECHRDDRGFFARTYSSREFMALGLEGNLSETSVSFNKMRGTLRGIHYQYSPDEEAKLVRVTMGAAFDVAVDLRQESRPISSGTEWNLAYRTTSLSISPRDLPMDSSHWKIVPKFFIRLPIHTIQSVPPDLRGMILK